MPTFVQTIEDLQHMLKEAERQKWAGLSLVGDASSSITEWWDDQFSIILLSEDIDGIPPNIGRLQHLWELEIIETNIKRLPPEVGELKHLSNLHIYGKPFAELPVEIGQLESLETLSVSNTSLSSLPTEIGQLKQLHSLELSDNLLTTLPKEIWDLTNLQRLDIDGNKFETLPPEICQLHNLVRLDLARNELSMVPSEIGLLSSLAYLDLSFNAKLSSLPKEIINLTNLIALFLNSNRFDTKYCNHFLETITYFTQLETLHLVNIGINSIPRKIDNLQSLEELDVHFNHLDTLPIEFGNLKSLKRLDITGNSFTSLPNSIFELENLEVFNAGENQLNSIDHKISNLKQLTTLNLGKTGQGLDYSIPSGEYANKIERLPLTLLQLKKLEELDLTGNPLPIPPEILQKTNEPPAILSAYFAESMDEDSVKELLDSISPLKNQVVRVFISYAREDIEAARKLYVSLKQVGVLPWLDEKSLLAGERWNEAILSAIKSSQYFIAVLSHKSVSKRGYVQKELKKALDVLDEFPDHEIFLIPVRVEECVPTSYRLHELNWVDMFPDWDDGFQKILKTIQRRKV